jgi:hypothetical protein
LTARLRVAGAKNGNSIFSKGAVEVIYEYSGGYPRMINSLADNVMLLGYSKGKKKITPLLVRQSHDDMNLAEPLSVSTQRAVPASRSKTKKRVQKGIRWKWAAVLLFVLALGALGTTGSVHDFFWDRVRPEAVSNQPSTDSSTKEPVLVRKRIEGEPEDPVPIHLAEQEPTPQVQTIQEDVEAVDIRQPEESREPSIPAERQEKKLSASIFVEEGSICRQVLDRKPVDVGNSFKAGVGKLYCFTRIALLKPPPTEITHVWYFGRTERARITLTIKSYHWRTYSSKTILPNEVGDWYVEVLGPEGEALSNMEFRTTR